MTDHTNTPGVSRVDGAESTPECSVELAVNTEPRRAGEVALGVIGSKVDGFCWVTADEAREFAWAILRAARDAEDDREVA